MDSMEPIPPLLVKSWQNLRVSLMTKAWLDSCLSSSSRNMTRMINCGKGEPQSNQCLYKK